MRYPLFLTMLLTASTLWGQLEFTPYLGVVLGDRAVLITEPLDELTAYTGDRLLLGADVLFGGGALAPLVGVAFQPNSYVSADGTRDFRYHHLQLPLGLAYRLLPADLDLNLLLTAALGPGLRLGDESTGTVLLDDAGVAWMGRGGILLYIYSATVGVQYRHQLNTGLPQRSGQWAVTAGLRF